MAGAEVPEPFEVAVVVLELVLELVLEFESEPLEADESLDLPVDAPVAVSAVEPRVVSVVGLAGEPDAALLFDVALSVL